MLYYTFIYFLLLVLSPVLRDFEYLFSIFNTLYYYYYMIHAHVDVVLVTYML